MDPRQTPQTLIQPPLLKHSQCYFFSLFLLGAHPFYLRLFTLVSFFFGYLDSLCGMCVCVCDGILKWGFLD